MKEKNTFILINLFVKEAKRMQFEREFLKEFGKDFILLTKEEVYKAKSESR